MIYRYPTCLQTSYNYLEVASIFIVLLFNEDLLWRETQFFVPLSLILRGYDNRKGLHDWFLTSTPFHSWKLFSLLVSLPRCHTREIFIFLNVEMVSNNATTGSVLKLTKSYDTSNQYILQRAFNFLVILYPQLKVLGPRTRDRDTHYTLNTI